ncbi:MAG: hypothetical protein ACREPY_11665 [Rhodanobacteraceae bacterium]
MIWGLAIVTVLAFVVAFTTHSPGLMGFCLFVGFVCGIVGTLVFIDRHLRASSRPEHMTERELDALRKTVRNGAEPPRSLPPSGSP